MEENKISEFDIFLTKIVKEAGVEAPSKNFTNAIIAKIGLKEEAKVKLYKPLISSFGWIFLSTSLFLGILATMFYNQGKTDATWVTGIFDGIFNSSLITSTINIKISDITSYAILGLVFFVYVQVFIVKKYRNKSYAI
ncbi:hypothetical protein [Cellulophaga sp. Hel_I_12]|uniref:hypothetical protein n=1 Tax=Cellulophaga sp. Hel_I_12 TaxID=1249972 RepID=UPI000647D012|nr:hypothetical protein [Cellulophaga sp. Hel_I_12]